MQDDALPVAGCFAKAGVPVNDRLQDQILEMRPHLVHDLIRKAQARVVHGQQNAFHFKGRVELVLDNLDGIQQFAQPFQSEVLALNGHHHAVGCGQRIQGEQPEAGRAVEHDEVVVVPHLLQGGAKLAFALLCMDQLNFRTDQVEVGGEDVEVGRGGGDNGAAEVHFARHHFVASLGHETWVNAYATRRIGLRVQVHQQGFEFQHPQARAEVDCSGGLSDPTFLVGDGDDFAHVCCSFRV